MVASPAQAHWFLESLGRPRSTAQGRPQITLESRKANSRTQSQARKFRFGRRGDWAPFSLSLFKVLTIYRVHYRHYLSLRQDWSPLASTNALFGIECAESTYAKPLWAGRIHVHPVEVQPMIVQERTIETEYRRTTPRLVRREPPNSSLEKQP